MANNDTFFGYNGQSYDRSAPTGDSFLGSNGQTYSQQQIQDWYKQNGAGGYDAEVRMLAELGLKTPDLYKARALNGQGNGGGIYTDPKEMEVYGQYLQGQQNRPGGLNSAQSFDQWRNNQDAGYLQSLQKKPTENVGWLLGDRGGYQVNTQGGEGYSGGGYGYGGGGYGYGGGGGGGGGGYGYTSSSGGNGPNPYLDQMANDIAMRSQKQMESGLQTVRGAAIGAGGLGGTRQGVAEGVAIGNNNDTLQGNLANLYGTDWTNGQNRSLQAYGINTNAALTNQGQMQSFYTANRGQDLQGIALGAQLYGQGNAGYLGQGQGIGAIGTQQQQAPWGVINNANAAISPYTGYGATNTQTGPSTGGGVGGAIGGGMAGWQIGKNLGLGGNSAPSEPYPGYNASIGM